MAKTDLDKKDEEPVTLEEPGDDKTTHDHDDRPDIPWMRGFTMIAVAIMFYVAGWLLLFATVLQFLWLAVARERNTNIAEFGENLSKWLAKAARFQTAASEDLPFPWSKWGS